MHEGKEHDEYDQDVAAKVPSLGLSNEVSEQHDCVKSACCHILAKELQSVQVLSLEWPGPPDDYDQSGR